MNTTPTPLNNITIRRSGTLVVRNKKGSKIETKTTETKNFSFFLREREQEKKPINFSHHATKKNECIRQTEEETHTQEIKK